MSEIEVLFDRKASENKEGVKVWTIYAVEPRDKKESASKRRKYEKIGCVYKGNRVLTPAGQVQSNCNIKLLQMFEKNERTGKMRKFVQVSYAFGGRELK
jgi:hypothetical protein